MNKIILTYEKSNEDIPTLIVGMEDGYNLFGDTRIRIKKVITGQKAEDIWEDLTGDKERKEIIKKACKEFLYSPCTAATEED